MSALISEDYATLNRKLHAERADYGRGGHRWAPVVRNLAQQAGSTHILDYGCGKGTLAAALPDLDVHGYDPAVPQYAADPAPADVLVCTDVLEHIEPENVEAVVAHIASKTKRLARQATHSHRDRTRIANLARRRGLAVDHALTKAYP